MSGLHNLKSFQGSKHSKKRIGRGNGSGHGTYSTKGNKGQKARSGGQMAARFEGGQTPLVKRIPKLKGFRNPNSTRYQAVNVSSLNQFENGDTVDVVSLFEKKLIQNKNMPIKILGNGELTKKLTVKTDRVVPAARAKIEGAKGEVVELTKKTKPEAK
ncbi:MAG: 50S ribosomal protein L15 [Candidatus Peregrinibacteria bacterium]|nr:50S ribosomal protein L15 [Candidatus Peregrinibacteria bacterium]